MVACCLLGTRQSDGPVYLDYFDSSDLCAGIEPAAGAGAAMLSTNITFAGLT